MSGHIPQVPAGGGDGGQEADYGDEGDDGGNQHEAARRRGGRR